MEHKKKIINDFINDIEIKKSFHFNKYKRYRNIDNSSKIAISLLNGVSITSIIIAMGPQLPLIMIITLCSTSIAGLISIIRQASNISYKLNTHHITLQQYTDLLRDIRLKIIRNHLESHDYDTMIENINIRLSIIEDNELI